MLHHAIYILFLLSNFCIGHFFQWRRQAWGTGACAPLEFDAHTNFSLYFGQENCIFLLPEAFCGLKYAENAIAAGAVPRTPLGELTTLRQTP